jgi:hypothetical protein
MEDLGKPVGSLTESGERLHRKPWAAPRVIEATSSVETNKTAISIHEQHSILSTNTMS